MSAGALAVEDVPPFPQTALVKLRQFLTVFPPPADATLSQPTQVLDLLLMIHPALGFITPAGWRSLESALESSGLGEWTTGIAECNHAEVALKGEGIWGWTLESIARVDDRTAKVTFARGGVEQVAVNVPAGPLAFMPFPLNAEAYPDIYQTPRFAHLLTSLFQLHALDRFDISFLPPSSSLQTSSASSSLLISTFASLLGYELETLHLYKEMGGREIWMRRVVNSGADGRGGITSWEPSLLTKAALEGRLVHLEGIDTLGATAGSLGRLLLDREGELWEGRRLVGPAASDEVNHDCAAPYCGMAHSRIALLSHSPHTTSSRTRRRRSASSPRRRKRRHRRNGSLKSLLPISSCCPRSRWISKRRNTFCSRLAARLTASLHWRLLLEPIDVPTRRLEAKVVDSAQPAWCELQSDWRSSPTRA